MERVGEAGEGQTSLKEILDELVRKSQALEKKKTELESWLQVWPKKYEELDKKVSQLERDIAMLKNEDQCLLGSREGESVVLGETDGFITVDVGGGRGSARHGNDSKDGGTVSFVCDAWKNMGFSTAAHLSLLAGSSRRSPMKDDVLLRGEGRCPFVEVSDNDDDCGGPLGDKRCGRRNNEKGNKELKRKGDSLSPVLGETFTQTLRDMADALKQCEQKRIKGKDSDHSLSKSNEVNSINHDQGAGSASAKSDYGSSEQKKGKEKVSNNNLSKSAGVNSNKHENGAGSASAKSDNASSLHKEHWKSEADMLVDFTLDDDLCMKAVCALYRWQRSKSMQRSAFGSFDGLLSPREILLAEFLTGGDPEGMLKKSVMNLLDHCPEGPSICRSIATIHFKQLFKIYWTKEDPFFPSS